MSKAFDTAAPAPPPRRRISHCRSQKGFTLIEVIVALAILGIAGTLVVRLFAVNLRNLGLSGDYVLATARAETELARVLDEEVLSEGHRTRMVNGGYAVDVTVSEVLHEKTGSLHTKVLQVHLIFRWTRGLAEKSVHLCTYKLVRKQP